MIYVQVYCYVLRLFTRVLNGEISIEDNNWEGMGKDRQMRGYSVEIIVVLMGYRVERSEARSHAEIDCSVFE